MYMKYTFTFFFSHQNKTLFNDKTKGAHISYKLFSIAAFFKRGLYLSHTYLQMNIFCTVMQYVCFSLIL